MAGKTNVRGVAKTDRGTYWAHYHRSLGCFETLAEAKAAIEKFTKSADPFLPQKQKAAKEAKATKKPKGPKAQKKARTATKAKTKSEQYANQAHPIAVAA
jgi:hypothetical protein